MKPCANTSGAVESKLPYDALFAGNCRTPASSASPVASAKDCSQQQAYKIERSPRCERLPSRARVVKVGGRFWLARLADGTIETLSGNDSRIVDAPRMADPRA